MITKGRDLDSMCGFFFGRPEPLDTALGLECGRESEGAMLAS